MELVFAALIWSADRIAYVPMSRNACAQVRRENIRSTKPLIECVSAKWTCERGFQLVD